MTILVTGGAGFIGANFILDWFKINDEPVINLDKLTYAGHKESLASVEDHNDYVFYEGDIGDGELVGKILSEHKPRAVLNFAAESHVDRSIDGPLAFIETNVVATMKFLQTCLVYWQSLSRSEQDAFRFLHVSTDEVYGTLEADDPAFTETTPYRPNSPYSASKASSDHLVRAYHHTYGLPVLTTNCSNNYGPLQYPEKLIPLMIDMALSDRPLPVYGDGGNVRDWLYVTDHCDALCTVLDRGTIGETYNIGGHNEKNNLEVVKTICKTLDELRPRSDGKPYAEQISFVTDRLGHDRRYAIDPSKMTEELDWEPAQTFEKGLRLTIEWYLDNQNWVKAVQQSDNTKAA